MSITDFSRKMLEQFAAKDPSLQRVKQSVDALQATLKDARRRGYSDDLVKELKKLGTDAIINEYEEDRSRRLAKLKLSIDKLEEEYRSKMLMSETAKKSRDNLSMKYGGMSGAELERAVQEYNLGQPLSPWELETLSVELVKRSHPGVDLFRQIVQQRGDDKPAKKLAPELYREMEERSATRFGEALIVVEGSRGQRVPQQHDISDFIAEST